MSYQVLARKYRPRTFQEMIGQEHVLQALVNALNLKRLHHAYLFTGTRGVGKTTIARILAKCLNCETGVTSIPCEQCLSCQEINQGRFVDLIEVDAASRTKVEDTRDLLDNVQYAPTRGRYKVYLIDEVHMLSNHSFNALLKTLEEPPPHIIFLLATTDPQRLPVTVLSRCLQFNLKNLTAEKIKAHLAQVLTQEKISFEPQALGLLAKGANGSVRDALSLLDQAVAFGGGQVIEVDVRSMLGTIEQTHMLQLLDALAINDAKTIIAIIDQLAEQSADFNAALEDLLSLIHRIALLQIIPDSNHSDPEHADKIQHLATQFTKEDLQLHYQIGLIGRRDLPLAPTPRSGFEMILLRMLAFRPVQGAGIKDQVSGIGKQTEELMDQASGKQAEKISAQKSNRNISTDPSPLVGESLSSCSDTGSGRRPGEGKDWPHIISQLNLSGFVLALAQHCAIKETSENHIHLLLDPSQAALQNPKREASLSEALSTYFGKPIRLQISLGSANLVTPMRDQHAKQSAQLEAATQAVTDDANIQTIVKLFDAKIQPGSIQIKDSKAESGVEK